MSEFKVEYSIDGNEVCIIPNPFIRFDDFLALVKSFKKRGYKWWLPADERRGYRFSKKNKIDCNQGEI